eukprot:scaffold6509_cov121-Isochrysis_galbana.AAC.3
MSPRARDAGEEAAAGGASTAADRADRRTRNQARTAQLNGRAHSWLCPGCVLSGASRYSAVQIKKKPASYIVHRTRRTLPTCARTHVHIYTHTYSRVDSPLPCSSRDVLALFVYSNSKAPLQIINNT